MNADIEHELTQCISRSVESPLQAALDRAKEEVAEVILKAAISKGFTLSSFIEAIANISDERGYGKATGLLEQASRLVQQDEPFQQ